MKHRLQKRLSGSRRDLLRDESGAAFVEFGLAASLLLLFLVAATDLALSILAKQQVASAARAGAHYASVFGNVSSGISTAALGAVPSPVTPISVASSGYCGCSGDPVGGASCGATTCSTGLSAGSYVQVTTTAAYTPLLPGLWNAFLTNGSMPLSSTAVVRLM